jgi:hypothetical protein
MLSGLGYQALPADFADSAFGNKAFNRGGIGEIAEKNEDQAFLGVLWG